jgi:hypothetical protein
MWDRLAPSTSFKIEGSVELPGTRMEALYSLAEQREGGGNLTKIRDSGYLRTVRFYVP